MRIPQVNYANPPCSYTFVMTSPLVLGRGMLMRHTAIPIHPLIPPPHSLFTPQRPSPAKQTRSNSPRDPKDISIPHRLLVPCVLKQYPERVHDGCPI